MANTRQLKVDIENITDASDMHTAFDIMCACFGRQNPDAILEAMNPKWDTPDGYARATQRMVTSFETGTSRDKNGHPNYIFAKATVIDDTGDRRMVGYASWIVLSGVEGYGEPPLLNFSEALNVEELYPGDVSEQGYCCKLFEELYRARHELVEMQASASPPAIMALDMCAVHPEFQGRGIGSMLVGYGLDEAERRGGLVSCTEATIMGRSTYARLGFVAQGSEIELGVDGAKFAAVKQVPVNVFMRTKVR